MKIKLFFKKGICLIGIATLFISCGKTIEPSEGATSSDSLVTTVSSQEAFSETTTIPSSSIQSDVISSHPTLSSKVIPMSPEVEALAKIAGKETWEYTDEDCKLLLTSSFEEICQAYGIDFEKEPFGGLFWVGTTQPTFITNLKNGIIVPYTSNKNEKIYGIMFNPYSDIRTTKSEFTFEMIYQSGMYAHMPYVVHESFIKYGQYSSEIPVKVLEFEENGLIYQFNFVQNENGEYRLTEEYVRLVE